MSRESGCDRCHVTTDEKGGRHHQPDCLEMRFPSGQPRWAVPASEAAFVEQRGTLTLQDELAAIFKQEAPDATA